MRCFSLLFLLFFFHEISGQNQSVQYCDSLIKSGIDALYKNEHRISLQKFTAAKKIAEQNKYYEQQFIATNCIGLNYYQMSDYGTALDYYLNAYSIAVKHLKSDREMSVLNNIALVYQQQGKYKEAEKHQKRAFDLAVANNDYIGIAIYAANLAELYNIENELDKAQKYIKTAREALAKKKDARIEIDVDIIEARNFLQRKNYTESLNILNPLLPKLVNKENLDARVSALLMLSKVYQGKNETTKSLEFLKQTQKQNNTYSNLVNIFEQFSDVYTMTADLNKSLQYKDSVIAVKDSLNSVRNQEMYQNIEIKVKLQDSEKELKNEKKLKFYIGAFSLAILILLGWLFRTSFVRYQQKKVIADNNQQIMLLELKNKENQNLLLEKEMKQKDIETSVEKEKLEGELESKNRQFAVNAIHVAQRNDKIEEYILKLKNRPEVLDQPYLIRQLDQMKSFLIKEDNNDDFLTHFEKINSRFISVLKSKHPDLTLNDIRFICYIYMNLSLKEIASIFNITIEACRKRKERISKRLQLENSNDLYGYISSI